MFRLLFEFLFSLFLCYSIIVLPTKGVIGDEADEPGEPQEPQESKRLSCREKDYKPPQNVHFPLGDEELNTNVLDTDQDQGDKLLVVNVEISGDADSHIPCGEGDGSLSPDVLYSSDSAPSPTVQCKKCALKIAPGGNSVIVHCTECHDIPEAPGPPESPESPEAEDRNIITKDIVYSTIFIEIANYTRPERHNLLPPEVPEE